MVPIFCARSILEKFFLVCAEGKHTAGQKILKSPGKKKLMKSNKSKKNFFHEIAFLAVLNCQKCNFAINFFDLFDFMSFLPRLFVNFFGPLWMKM